MVIGKTHHSTIGTTSAKNGHTTVSSTLVQQSKADYREPIDSDDESDDSNYAEFLSFLQTPSPTQTKKVMNNEHFPVQLEYSLNRTTISLLQKVKFFPTYT